MCGRDREGAEGRVPLLFLNLVFRYMKGIFGMYSFDNECKNSSVPTCVMYRRYGDVTMRFCGV